MAPATRPLTIYRLNMIIMIIGGIEAITPAVASKEIGTTGLAAIDAITTGAVCEATVWVKMKAKKNSL